MPTQSSIRSRLPTTATVAGSVSVNMTLLLTPPHEATSACETGNANANGIETGTGIGTCVMYMFPAHRMDIGMRDLHRHRDAMRMRRLGTGLAQLCLRPLLRTLLRVVPRLDRRMDVRTRRRVGRRSGRRLNGGIGSIISMSMRGDWSAMGWMGREDRDKDKDSKCKCKDKDKDRCKGKGKGQGKCKDKDKMDEGKGKG